MGITEAQYAAMLANPDIIANEQGGNPRHEAQEQMRLMAWVAANLDIYPGLRWLFHVPNGEYRDKATGGRLKAMGVRRGVPDILLPVRCGEYVGLAIELKRADRSNKATTEQVDWLSFLDKQGWAVEICYGAAGAIDTIEWYLGEVQP